MNTRPATDEDHPELFEMHREAFGSHIEQIWGWDERWQRKNFEAEIRSTVTSVIEIDGQVAGYFQVRVEEDRIYLQNIAISSNFRGKGFGDRIVKGLQHHAVVRGVPLELAVFRTNSDAQRFYERCGFSIVGKTDDFVEMSFQLNNKIDK